MDVQKTIACAGKSMCSISFEDVKNLTNFHAYYSDSITLILNIS